MWKNGSTAMNVSSSRMSAAADSTCATLATRLPWLSMTPLFTPVVPDEYGSTTRVSDVTGTCSASGAPNSAVTGVAPSASPRTKISVTPVPSAPFVATSRNIGIVTRMVAFESSSCLLTS